MRKVKRVAALMAAIPTVPDEAEEWVYDKVFPEQMMFVEKKETGTECSCTACGSSVQPGKGWKHNIRITCPSCGRAVIVKKLVRRVEKKQKVILFFELDQKTWVERLFTAKCVWEGRMKKIYLNAEITVLINKGEFWGKVYYGQGHECDEFAQDWWITNPISKRWGDALLYPGNLKEILPMTGLQNSGIDIMAGKGIPFDVNAFIITFKERQYMEYLIKGGFTELTADILRRYRRWSDPSGFNRKANNLRDFLRLDGNRLNRLKQLNGGLSAWKWLQYECDSGSRVSQESLEYLEKNRIWPEDMREYLEELGSVQRVVNYLKKQKMKPLSTITTWKDYLNMARAEGMDIEDDIVRFPKDLKARHDELVQIRNERRDEENRKVQEKKYAEFDQQIIQNLPKVKLYYWQNQDYVFVPAGRCAELQEEGRTLHHCVGSSDRYMRRMADGESWILFLRKRAEMEKPYYTIEIRLKDDEIIQWYSEYDRKPDKEIIAKVLAEYKKYLASARRKEKREAAGSELMLTAG